MAREGSKNCNQRRQTPDKLVQIQLRIRLTQHCFSREFQGFIIRARHRELDWAERRQLSTMILGFKLCQ